jgi:3-deoxy-D-manno-octulosonic-acid transferase
MYLLYSLMLAAVAVLAAPYWLWQMLRNGKYFEGLSERLGNVPSRLKPSIATGDCVWVHAVSVGEVIAVSGLLARLQKEYPGWRLVVSTTTRTGQQVARERFGDENVFYFPLDLAFAVRPYFKHLRPRLILLAETEFWPNFLSIALASGARIAVVNARISDRSFPRYRSFRQIFRRVLRDIDLFLAQSEEDRQRLVAIGADANRVQVSGNLKFDVTSRASSSLVDQLREAVSPNANIIVAGSTVEGEEELLLPAIKRALRDAPETLVILAPRHPERFDEVARKLQAAGVSFWRRSTWNNQPLRGGVLLLDTIGELAAIYSIATIAFVGGSLVPRGGHNILEPAQFGKVVLVGPYTENFRDIVEIFRRAEAIRVITAEELQQNGWPLLADAGARNALGDRARQVFESQAGATQRTLDAIKVLLWMPDSLRSRYSSGQAAQ